MKEILKPSKVLAAKRSDGGWQFLGTKYAFQSPWFNLIQDDLNLPNGEQISYTYVDHSGYVVVIPVLDDGNVVMEWVFRHTIQQTVLECPMGGLDGEEPEIAAARELEEETGYIATCFKSLGHFYGSTGISNELFYVVLATGVSNTGKICRESTEQIEVEIMSHAHLNALAGNGQIVSAPTTLALLLADSHIKNFLTEKS